MEQLTIEKAGPFLQKPGPGMLILPTQQLTGALREMPTNTVTFRSAGIDTARFRRIDLTAVIKPQN